jgi:PRTRC genetic system protein A
MIPVFFKTEAFSKPESTLYFLIAKNGLFVACKTNLYTSVTRASRPNGLMDQEQALALHFPKIPRDIMEQVLGFFEAVYKKWEGEAIVFLFYNTTNKAFRIGVPAQTLFRYKSVGRWRTEMRIEYESAPRPPGFIKLGDIHSHADLPAFFSCADDNDDAEDGLRIVIGKLDRSAPDIRASFVVGRTRFVLAPNDIVEEFSRTMTPPQEWLEKVFLREEIDDGTGRDSGNDPGKENCED